MKNVYYERKKIMEKEHCCGECVNFLAYCYQCRVRGTYHRRWDKGKDACLNCFTPGNPIEFDKMVIEPYED